MVHAVVVLTWVVGKVDVTSVFVGVRVDTDVVYVVDRKVVEVKGGVVDACLQNSQHSSSLAGQSKSSHCSFLSPNAQSKINSKRNLNYIILCVMCGYFHREFR